MIEDLVADLVLGAQEKCIKQHALTAVQKQKFLSSQLKEDLCTVEIATRSTKLIEDLTLETTEAQQAEATLKNQKISKGLLNV